MLCVWGQLRGLACRFQCAGLTCSALQESQSTVVHNPPDGVKVRFELFLCERHPATSLSEPLDLKLAAVDFSVFLPALDRDQQRAMLPMMKRK